MTTKWNIITFGSLFVLVCMCVVGMVYQPATDWGGKVALIGFLGLAAWLCGAVWLGLQLNSDI